MATEWEDDSKRWRSRILTGQHGHWCPDWDFLPIDETCPEWPCPCTASDGWQGPIQPLEERMDDIVERLTERYTLRYMANCKCGKCQLVPLEMLGHALDTLRSQREEIGRMREALKQIAYGEPDYSVYAWRHYHELARSALSDTTRGK